MVDISAQNLNNSGHIQGDIALIDARQDINIDGGSIAANTGMALQAGGEINIASTLHSATNEVGDNTFSLQGIDRVAGLYVNGEAGNLLASAGGAINLTAAELHNIGSGVTQLTAGSDINLDTLLDVGQSHALNWDANNYHHQSHSEEIGSVITGGGAINLTAGQDIHLRAATVDAQGALALNAIGGNITLEAGQRSESLAEGHSSSSGGLFSSKTKVTRTRNASTQALATELGGQTVSLISGEDIRVSGANIVADQDLGMHAGGNLTLDAEQNTLSNSHFSRSKRSGLFSGGLGINLGSQRQMTDATNTATFVAPTTVGSIGGNVTLTAGDSYTQIGSDVLAPSGDILIGANTVNILEGRETSNHRTEQRFKQSGLSLSLSNPVMDSAQGIKGQIDAAGNTDSPRMQALAAANTAIGALTGGTAGATGAAVGTLSAPAVASALKNAGLDDALTDGLTALASTAAGAATGGSQGGAAAFNEVVNNYLRHDQVDAYIDELEGCVARGDCGEVQEKFRALSIAQQDELIALCATDAEACTANYQSLVEDGEQFRDALDGFSGRDIPWQLGLDAGPLLSQYMEVEAIVSQEGFAQFLQEQHGLDVEQASVLSAVAAGMLPLGSKRLQLNQPKNPSYQPVRNESTNIGGREYSGHALDRMQDRGILPSVVENTIRNGQSYPSRGGTTVFHSSENNISVVVNHQGDVVTTRYGR